MPLDFHVTGSTVSVDPCAVLVKADVTGAPRPTLTVENKNKNPQKFDLVIAGMRVLNANQ